MENPETSGLYRTHNTSKSNHSENGKKSSPATPSKAVNFSTDEVYIRMIFMTT